MLNLISNCIINSFKEINLDIFKNIPKYKQKIAIFRSKNYIQFIKLELINKLFKQKINI